jgi:hypothetical protein
VVVDPYRAEKYGLVLVSKGLFPMRYMLVLI